MSEDRSTQRFEISVQGRYRTGSGVARDVPILDISETGCRMYDRFGRMPKGTVLSLRVGAVGPVAATVAWCKDCVVGIHFDRALYGPVFEHLRAEVAAATAEQALRNAG